MYKVDVKQQNFQDALSTETTKTGFSKSLQEQMTYHNEDDAKKLAVKQGVDYDQFHQMVLGANLKPISKQEKVDQIVANKKKTVTSSMSQEEILMQNLLNEAMK